MIQPRLIYLLLCLGLCFSLEAQVFKARVDSTQMSLGKTNTLRLTIVKPYDEIAFTGLEQISEDIPMWRVIEESDWTLESDRQWVKEVTFSIYDTGQYVMSPITAIAAKGNRIDTLLSNPLPFSVSFSDTSLDNLDIKDIFKEGLSWRDFVIPMLVVIGIVLLIPLLMWWTRRKTNTPEEELAPPPVPAHITAFAALDELEQAQLWKSGGYKEHQTQLSMITRRYLEDGYQIPAPESTTREILTFVKKLGLSSSQHTLLKELLELSDLVKYAKAEPPEESNLRLLNGARTFVTEMESKSQIAEEE